MIRRNSLSRLLQTFVGLVCVAGVSAVGETMYFVTAGQTLRWETTANWRTACQGGSPLNRIPGPNDTAVICSGQTCQVSAGTAGRLVVEAGATLDVLGGVLNITGGGLTPSEVYGTVDLKGNLTLAGDLAVQGWVNLGSADAAGQLSIMKDLTIFGSGFVRGHNPAAKIGLASNFPSRTVLTNRTTIEGKLTIVNVGG